MRRCLAFGVLVLCSPLFGVTVWVGAGTYHLDKALSLTKADSGAPADPTVYRAQAAREVRLVGGREVTGFKPVTDPEIRACLQASVRGKVVCADLRAQGIQDYGEVAAPGKRLEFFFNDQAMQLARWPNKGFVRVKEVRGETPMTTHGIKGTREGKFTYAEDRPANWTDEPDIWLHGYWFWDWSASLYVDARGVGWMKYHVDPGGTLPERLKAMPYQQPPWSQKYPELLDILEDEPGLPKGNVVRHNISYKGKWLDVESKALPLIEFDEEEVTDLISLAGRSTPMIAREAVGNC